MDENDRLLTITEVAELLGVPVATIRWWIHNGTGPEHVKLGRHIRFWLSEVLRWIEAHRRRAG